MSKKELSKNLLIDLTANVIQGRTSPLAQGGYVDSRQTQETRAMNDDISNEEYFCPVCDRRYFGSNCPCDSLGHLDKSDFDPDMPKPTIAEEISIRRALLLREFVYHWRRGNLLPYRAGFEELINDLCERSDKEFEHPVNAMSPMPQPTL